MKTTSETTWIGRRCLAMILCAVSVIVNAKSPQPDLSVNTTNFPHLKSVLASERGPHLLWFGDSTGADTYYGVYTWLANKTLAGVQNGLPFMGWAISYTVYNAPVSYYTDPYYFWVPTSCVALGAGTNAFFACGASAGGGPLALTGNRLQIWYFSSASNGVATIQVSSNNLTWTTLGTINETVGTLEGTLQVTNYSLATAAWYAQIRVTGGSFRMPAGGIGIFLTNSTSASIFDLNAGGLQLSDWLNMGSNNICCILTNLTPDVVIYQQTKPISGYSDYPAFFNYMSNYGLCDVALGAAQVSVGEVAYLMQSPPINSDAYSAAYIRGVAVTNNCPFWDNYDPLSSRAAITNLGWNADSVIHLNAAGQFFCARLFLRDFDWPGLWKKAGLFYTNFTLTLAPSSILANACMLNTFVNANGVLTTNYFQFGQTSQYGSQTIPESTGSFTGQYSAGISNLLPYTVYHFRPVMANATGIRYGDDLTFFTPATPFAISTYGFNGMDDFHIAFTGTSNVTFTLWDSTNLTDWAEIAISTQNSLTNYSVDDMTATHAASRFYQLRWP